MRIAIEEIGNSQGNVNVRHLQSLLDAIVERLGTIGSFRDLLLRLVTDTAGFLKPSSVAHNLAHLAGSHRKLSFLQS